MVAIPYLFTLVRMAFCDFSASFSAVDLENPPVIVKMTMFSHPWKEGSSKNECSHH
jgi:hypothetical protein